MRHPLRALVAVLVAARVAADCKLCTKSTLYSGDCWDIMKKTNKWDNWLEEADWPPTGRESCKKTCCADDKDDCCE